VLVASDLAFARAERQLAYRFSFTAAPGEITAVSGASGAGKSTLLDLVAGFLAPTSGTLTLDGRDLLPLAPEARPVSILFQSDSLFEHLSAGANLALGLPADTPRAERDTRIDAALAEVGLPQVAAQRAGTLSGGEQQRVALARTLLRNRPVLLLDEPFSALDDATRRDVRDLVLRLTRERNWITLLVSHHQDDIATLATRRYALADGVLGMVE
jgi:thiamine transport system ATP-binding protein